MDLERDAVAPGSRRLVSSLRALDHEAVGQILHGRGRPGDLALLARVGAATHGGEEVLRELARLIDGDLAVGAERRLAPLARERAIREHEGLAPGGRYLAEKARDNGVPDFIVAGGWSGGIDDALGELGGRHVRLLAGPDFQERCPARRAAHRLEGENGVGVEWRAAFPTMPSGGRVEAGSG